MLGFGDKVPYKKLGKLRFQGGEGATAENRRGKTDGQEKARKKRELRVHQRVWES